MTRDEIAGLMAGLITVLIILISATTIIMVIYFHLSNKRVMRFSLKTKRILVEAILSDNEK